MSSFNWLLPLQYKNTVHVEVHRTAFSQTALKLDWTCPVLSEWGNHPLEVAFLLKKTLNTRSLLQILWSVRNLQPFARAPGGAAVDRVSQTYSMAPGIPAAATSISSIFNVVSDAALFFSQRAETGMLTPSAQNPVLIHDLCPREQGWESPKCKAQLPLLAGEQEQSSSLHVHCNEQRPLFTFRNEDWRSQGSWPNLGT